MSSGTPGLSFANGLMQGYGFMDSIKREDEAKARQQMLDARAEEHYQEGNQRANQELQLQQNADQRQQALTQQQEQLNKINISEKQKQIADQDNIHYGNAAYLYVTQGIEPDAKTKVWAQKNGINLNNITSLEYTNAADQIVNYMQNLQAGKPSTTNLVDPLNVILQDKLAKRIGGPAKMGGTIQNVKINRIVPAQNDPSSVYFNLDVTAKKPDGTVYTYQAPMTENGSIADNAKVQPFKIKDVVGDVMSRVHLNRTLRAALQAKVMESGGTLPVHQYMPITKNGGVFDKTTGTTVVQPNANNPYPNGMKPSTYVSMYNAAKDGVKTLYLQANPMGNLFLPDGSQMDLSRSLDIADKLLAKGVTPGSATLMSYVAVRGAMNDAQAKDKAIAQIKQQNPDISDDDLQKQAAMLAPQLKAQSEQALQDYQRIMKVSQDSQSTGLKPIQAKQTTTDSQLSTPLAVRKAMRAGKISREEARKRLQSMNFGG